MWVVSGALTSRRWFSESRKQSSSQVQNCKYLYTRPVDCITVCFDDDFKSCTSYSRLKDPDANVNLAS